MHQSEVAGCKAKVRGHKVKKQKCSDSQKAVREEEEEGKTVDGAVLYSSLYCINF